MNSKRKVISCVRYRKSHDGTKCLHYYGVGRCKLFEVCPEYKKKLASINVLDTYQASDLGQIPSDVIPIPESIYPDIIQFADIARCKSRCPDYMKHAIDDPICRKDLYDLCLKINKGPSTVTMIKERIYQNFESA